jgi:hypothetical protein
MVASATIVTEVIRPLQTLVSPSPERARVEPCATKEAAVRMGVAILLESPTDPNRQRTQHADR